MTERASSREGAMWTEFAAPRRAFVARRVLAGIDPDVWFRMCSCGRCVTSTHCASPTGSRRGSFKSRVTRSGCNACPEATRPTAVTGVFGIERRS
jgi:hypothetical protein